MTNEENDSGLAFITFIIIVIILTGLTANYIYSKSLSNAFQKACELEGYDKLTDYKDITNYRYSDKTPTRIYKIECDNIILDRYKNFANINGGLGLQIDDYKSCEKRDKWGECMRHSNHYKFYLIKKDTSKRLLVYEK